MPTDTLPHTAIRSALPFGARGPLSDLLSRTLVGEVDTPAVGDAPALARAITHTTPNVLKDDDAQLSLFLLYALHYGSLPLEPAWEWDPTLIHARRILEHAHEDALRDIAVVEDPPAPVQADVAAWLFALTAPTSAPGMSRFVAKNATLEQLREFLIHRSVYTLREADPHSWAIPRLTGRAKAALVEIQSDEYGGGDPARVHATIFARTMEGFGLDASYGAYIDDVPAVTIASLNTMSLFGLNQRLRGAIVGHLAAFEMTSSLPNRGYGDGFRRHGFGEDVTWYFDEHVEADAVHEQIAGRDLAGSLAEDHPELLPDILFGAAACLAMDELTGEHVTSRWQSGRSSLRIPVASEPS